MCKAGRYAVVAVQARPATTRRTHCGVRLSHAHRHTRPRACWRNSQLLDQASPVPGHPPSYPAILPLTTCECCYIVIS